MDKNNKKKRRCWQLAIFLTFLGSWSSDAVCWGQAAGFAQSRQEPSAKAESGGVRSFVSSLNPFKRDANEPTAQTPSRVSLAPPPSASRFSTPSAEEERATLISQAPRSAVAFGSASQKPVGGAERLSLGTIRRPTPSGVSNAKKSSTGGVAALLLDELEAEIGDEPLETAPTVGAPSSSSVRRTTTERRSLREGRVDSLELLGEDAFLEESDETPVNANAIETDAATDAEAFSADDGPAIPTLTTESTETIVVDEPTDESSSAAAKSKKSEKAEAIDETADAPLSVVAIPDAPNEPNVSRTSQDPETAALDARFGAFFEDEQTDTKIETGIKTVIEAPVEIGARVENERVETANGSTNAVSAQPARIGANSFGDSRAASLERTSSRSPIVEIETLGPKKLIVGQESAYKIRVRNAGSVAANKLTITTDLPETVAASSVLPEQGAAQIENFDDGGAKRCRWDVGTLDAGKSVELTLNLTPMKRVAFELVSRFEYERTAARAGVEVQEPILEAIIEGRDAIEWGVEDKYRLRLRNVGNGDAEDVDLFVSTGEDAASQRLGVLRAGEEKTIEMSVKTVLEDEISVDVRATGAYGVETSATKKIAILRGKLEVCVEAPELQFVDGEVEATVRVKNVGDAALQNVDVVAQTPESVEILSCGGNARFNPEKRRVYWSIPLIRPGEEAAYKAVCRLRSAGDAIFAVVGSDASGATAQSETTVQVESIALLGMRVKAPKEPVAVGKECVYELTIENNGTKVAQEIESGVCLSSGMKPIAIEDGKGAIYETESKVLFNKIGRLEAGESIVFRIRAQAVAPGNHKVQAMLQSLPEDARLLSEETTYCYDRTRTPRNSEKSPSMVALETSEGESAQRK